MDQKKKATLTRLWGDSWKGGTSKDHKRSFWRVHDGTWGRTLKTEVSNSVATGDAKVAILEGTEWVTLFDLKGEDLDREDQEKLLLERTALLMNWSLENVKVGK